MPVNRGEHGSFVLAFGPNLEHLDIAGSALAVDVESLLDKERLILGRRMALQNLLDFLWGVIYNVT